MRQKKPSQRVHSKETRQDKTSHLTRSYNLYTHRKERRRRQEAKPSMRAGVEDAYDRQQRLDRQSRDRD